MAASLSILIINHNKVSELNQNSCSAALLPLALLTKQKQLLVLVQGLVPQTIVLSMNVSKLD